MIVETRSPLDRPGQRYYKQTKIGLKDLFQQVILIGPWLNLMKMTPIIDVSMLRVPLMLDELPQWRYVETNPPTIEEVNQFATGLIPGVNYRYNSELDQGEILVNGEWLVMHVARPDYQHRTAARNLNEDLPSEAWPIWGPHSSS